MKTILFALALCGLTMSNAEAKPHAKHKARTHAKAKSHAHSHQRARPHAKPRVVYHVARPAQPPRAHGSHVVFFHNGHWVRTHRNPFFMWKWNHIVGRWTVTIRF
jgi:hypothetical protein